MGDLIFLHEAKYKKTMDTSKKEINLIVNNIANLLKIKPITYKEYKAYLHSKVLNYVYIVYDIMDKKLDKNKASWKILTIYYKNNSVVSLGIKADYKENYYSHVLYIDGLLCVTPTIHDIFSQISFYITNKIYPEIKNYEK